MFPIGPTVSATSTSCGDLRGQYRCFVLVHGSPDGVEGGFRLGILSGLTTGDIRSQHSGKHPARSESFIWKLFESSLHYV